MTGKGIVLFSILLLASDVASKLVDPLPQNKASLRGTPNVAFSCNSTYGSSFITWTVLLVGESASKPIASGSTVVPGYEEMYNVSQSGNSVNTLTVKTVSESLAGTYFCTEAGASPVSAQLIVYNSDPVCAPDLTGQDLIQGQSVQMNCSFNYTATSSSVGVNMAWSKGSSSSSVQSPSPVITPTGTLNTAVSTIMQTVGQSSPFPVYRCQTSFNVTGTTATNDPGYNKTAQPYSSPINVLYFISTCSIKGATPGQSVYVGANISCEVDANPQPSYRWSNATNNATLSSASSILIMSDGEYTCTASNSVGSCTKSISLTVYSTPAPSTGGELSETNKIIIGVVVGVGGFLLILAIIIIICCCKKKNKSGAKYENGNSKPMADYPPPYDGHVGPQRTARPDSVVYASADRQHPSQSSYVSNSPAHPHIGDDGLNYAQIQLDNQPRSRQPLQMPENNSNYVEIALA